ncbi:MAG: hypothetical protein K1X79_10760 [Oligoflexia bacterium]|nr:hypothetical protein [Oligoflexia bacterium]
MQRSDKILWLMSFGDLLTLVLAFFVSLIALSPLNPKVNLPHKPGTTIASSEPASPKGALMDEDSNTEGLTLYLNSGDFEAGGTALSEGGRSKVKTFIQSAGYEVNQATIADCAGGTADEGQASWNSSMNRLLGLHRQFIDALPSSTRLMLQTWGNTCGGSNATEQARPLAMIRLRK